ncbi:MAG: hypothetical protein EA417_02265 [Gammaproteobacteria bacterium]|nr:MAG: hypothetical protein EA417_02265 [Gammaproteobacteria bacterium]
MSQPPIKLSTLPQQDRSSHSAFALNVPAVARWLEQLPRANTGATTRALFNAVVELNRVQMPAARRLQLLDRLIPVWQDVRDRLQRQHLGKGGLLAAQPRQVARLLESMTTSITSGYTLVALHSRTETVRDRLESRSQIARAVSGALASQRYNLLLASLFYQTPRAGFWKSVHDLYLLAQDQGVELERIELEGRTFTVWDLYLSCLLFAAAGLNQLHQRDLDGLYRRMPGWACHVDLAPGVPERCLLAVNPAEDAGPVYRDKCVSTSMRWLGLDVRELVKALENELELPTLPAERTLLLHLTETWGQAQSRSFMRIDSRETLLVSIGLDATHRHVAGDEDFDGLTPSGEIASLAQDTGNPFVDGRTERQQRSRDIWDSVYDPGAVSAEAVTQIDVHVRDHQMTKTAPEPLPPHYRVETINASPRGYCLRWPKDADAPLHSGEVIGVRREKGGDQWMVGVIRWVRMAAGKPEVGIELLSASALPYLARVAGQNARQRVLMLPAMKAIGQPAMLLTPRVQWADRQKVMLLRHDEQVLVVLTKQVDSRSGFNQFEFRQVEHVREASAMVSADEPSFEGLWERL